MCGRCCWITTVMVVKTVRAPKGLVDPVSSQKIPRQGAPTVFFFVKTMIKAAAATSSAEVLCSSSPKVSSPSSSWYSGSSSKGITGAGIVVGLFFHNNQSLHRALTRSKVNFLIFLIFNDACIHWEQVTARKLAQNQLFLLKSINRQTQRSDHSWQANCVDWLTD